MNPGNKYPDRIWHIPEKLINAFILQEICFGMLHINPRMPCQVRNHK